jgi:hypothetical protein
LLAQASAEDKREYMLEYEALRCIVLVQTSAKPADNGESVKLFKNLLFKKTPPHLKGLCQALAVLAESDPEILGGALNDPGKDLRSLPPGVQPYVYYARALVYQKQGELGLAAKDVVEAFRNAPTDLETEPRRERAASIFQEAARELRSNEGFARPFTSPDRAKSAFLWLDRARSLWTQGKPLPLSLRANLALAAWYKPERDGALVRQLTAELLQRTGPELLDAKDVCPLLLVHARAHAELPQGQEAALEGYSELLEQLTKQGAEPIADEDLYKIVLKPATTLGNALVGPKPGSGLAKRMAALYAAQGRLIRDCLNAPWLKEDVKDPLQEAFNLYQRAFDLDDKQAKYLVDRAYAESNLQYPNWDKLLREAKQAGELDPKLPRAHGLRGYVLLLKSRQERDREERIRNLRDSLAAFEEALAAKGNERDAEYASLLTDSSNSHLALGNYLVKESERRQHLYAARDKAKLATDAQPKHPYAWEALGDALEDIAWVLGETGSEEKSTYAEATEAFGKAIVCQPHRPQPWLGRGRCHYRWVESGTRGAPKDQDAAIEDLREAIKRVPNSVEAAEASYWLAMIYMRPQGQNYALADQYFDDAVSMAEKCHARDWSEMALKGWAQLALNQKKLSKARERAEKLKAFNTPEAARIIGRAYVSEGEPKDALKAYNAALPELSRMNPSHVLLIMARVELLLSPQAKKLPEKSRPGYHVILADLDRAADLALDRPVKAAAIGTAGLVRYLASAGSGLSPEQKAELCSEAAKGLDEAILLAPRHPNAWTWRWVWVELLSLQSKRTPAEIKKAVERIREASRTVPPGPDFASERDRIGFLVKEYERLALLARGASTVGMMGFAFGQGPVLATVALLPGVPERLSRAN